MSASHRQPLPAAPPRVSLPGLVRGLAGVFVLIGAAALAWAFTSGNATLAWSTYLIGMFFVLGLGVFGVAWLSILTLAGSTWSVTMRRIPEAMTAWLMPGGVLAMLVTFGAHSLYHWADAEAVAADALLTHKAPFLNLGMFTALVGVSLVLWVAFATWMVSASRRQDCDGGMAATRDRKSVV